ncbi:MAG TPA: ABC transporter ATP-binding protein [Thermoleophilaceae bacterium]
MKRWPGVPVVLEGVDLTLAAGSAIAIVGRNGTGKTTLLRIGVGLIAPEEGSVRLAGLDPERDRTEFQRNAGFVSAGNSGLYARLSVRHHLDLWARLALIPRAERREATERVTSHFALEELLGRRVDRMSMGQRQRLRLALGFLHGPRVVFLDEPTTSLDDEGIALLGAAIESLKAAGGAAIACLPAHWEQIPGIDSAHVLVNGRLEAT